VSGPDVAAVLRVQQRSYGGAGRGIRGAWPEEQALDREGMSRLLADVTYGVLATSRPDGRAHAAPVSYSLEGGSFWVATVEGLRLRNLRSTPWASLVLFDGQRGEQHRALTAEGPVHLHEDAELAAARDWLDEQWAARHGSAPAWAAALIELLPEHVFSYGSSGA
jgi:nitroimidazol reductase NimA-like FMN-containing flavoprotein (pyridoxamine 5'-phosphate oxidase superfamily)